MTDFAALHANVISEAAACTDPAIAALKFDQARADMWRWRRRYRREVPEWRSASRRANDLVLYDVDPTGGRAAARADRLWLEMGVTVRLYRNARDCARYWRRAIKRLEATDGN